MLSCQIDAKLVSLVESVLRQE